MKVFFLFSAITLLVACNNESSNTDSPTDTTRIVDGKAKEEILGTDCYQWTANKDTVVFAMERGTGVRNGLLEYNWSEKDRNKGNWRGRAEGDILTGWYNFQSEGIQSVRQVAWKIKGDELWPALGAVSVKSDTSYFVNMSEIRYDSTMALKRVPCR